MPGQRRITNLGAPEDDYVSGYLEIGSTPPFYRAIQIGRETYFYRSHSFPMKPEEIADSDGYCRDEPHCCHACKI